MAFPVHDGLRPAIREVSRPPALALGQTDEGTVSVTASGQGVGVLPVRKKLTWPLAAWIVRPRSPATSWFVLNTRLWPFPPATGTDYGVSTFPSWPSTSFRFSLTPFGSYYFSVTSWSISSNGLSLPAWPRHEHRHTTFQKTFSALRTVYYYSTTTTLSKKCPSCASLITFLTTLPSSAFGESNDSRVNMWWVSNHVTQEASEERPPDTKRRQYQTKFSLSSAMRRGRDRRRSMGKHLDGRPLWNATFDKGRLFILYRTEF